jgi:hypothetical protein
MVYFILTVGGRNEMWKFINVGYEFLVKVECGLLMGILDSGISHALYTSPSIRSGASLM